MIPTDWLRFTDLTFMWMFSDGTMSNESLVTHNFSTPGEHCVSLVVIDANGQESETNLE